MLTLPKEGVTLTERGLPIVMLLFQEASSQMTQKRMEELAMESVKIESCCRMVEGIYHPFTILRPPGTESWITAKNKC